MISLPDHLVIRCAALSPPGDQAALVGTCRRMHRLAADLVPTWPLPQRLRYHMDRLRPDTPHFPRGRDGVLPSASIYVSEEAGPDGPVIRVRCCGIYRVMSRGYVAAMPSGMAREIARSSWVDYAPGRIAEVASAIRVLMAHGGVQLAGGCSKADRRMLSGPEAQCQCLVLGGVCASCACNMPL